MGDKEKESKDQESQKEEKKEDKKEEKQESKKDESQDEEESQEASQEEESKQQAAPDTRPPSIIYGPAAPRPLTMTFGELLDYHAEVRPNKLAYISHKEGGKSITWKKLQERSLQLAQGFLADGVKKGDLIALSMGSRIEYFETFFATAYIGAALITLNYAYAQNEFVELLRIIAPKILVAPVGFAFYDYSELFPILDQEIPNLKKFVICEDLDGKYTMDPKSSKYAWYEKYLGQHKASRKGFPKDLSCHDMVNVEFTSGSTGLPKNVALSHYNIMNCGRFIWQQVRMSDEDVICLPVPLFHSFGMCVGLGGATVAGACMVFPAELFNAKAALECIEKYKCTSIYGVPTMFVTEMQHESFAKTDRSTIKFGIIAGAAMPPELLKRIVNTFPMPRLYTCWGMTELSSFVTMMHETDPFDKRVNTAGRLFPGYVAKIVYPNTGIAVPWGEKGEIIVSGFGQMSEYLHNEKKTKEALQYHPEDLEPGGVGGLGDGTVLRRWMHTEDEGYLDPEGYFVISGRIKDLVIRGGENISPMEIEQRMVEHEGVNQVSIIGVPDEKYGEEILAFVEASGDGEKPSDDDLRAFVREKLARFKAPRYFKWLGSGEEGVPDEWPQTDTGKISKPDLRKLVDNLKLE